MSRVRVPASLELLWVTLKIAQCCLKRCSTSSFKKTMNEAISRDLSLASKEKMLCEHIAFLQSAVVAYSGGVDSALVAKICQEQLGSKSLVVIADSPSLAQFELQTARSLARRHNFVMRIIATNELEDGRYSKNDTKRCFYCKDELYFHLEKIRKEGGYRAILNGANLDDKGDFRPGAKAANVFGVVSPLLQANIGKEEIRLLAKKYGLENHDKPASPCLSSRIPHGIAVDAKKLKQIEQAEDFLRNRFGVDDFRVRHMGEVVSTGEVEHAGDRARIDIDKKEHDLLLKNWLDIEKNFAQLGFAEVELFEGGLVSGVFTKHLKL